jgi:hypothetical protein
MSHYIITSDQCPEESDEITYGVSMLHTSPDGEPRHVDGPILTDPTMQELFQEALAVLGAFKGAFREVSSTDVKGMPGWFTPETLPQDDVQVILAVRDGDGVHVSTSPANWYRDRSGDTFARERWLGWRPYSGGEQPWEDWEYQWQLYLEETS